MKNIYVIGAGGHGAVVAEIADSLGWSITGFIDDDPAKAGATVLRWRVLGGRECVPDGAVVALGIGNNAWRAAMLEDADRHGWQLPVLVHLSAVISPSAELGAGTVVKAHTAVDARAVIGRGCVLNTGCSVGHDCRLEDGIHIAPGVRLAGDVVVGHGTLVGIGACARQGIVIGSECTIGAGSVVVADVAAGSTCYGNPARVRAKNCK